MSLCKSRDMDVTHDIIEFDDDEDIVPLKRIRRSTNSVVHVEINSTPSREKVNDTKQTPKHEKVNKHNKSPKLFKETQNRTPITKFFKKLHKTPSESVLNDTFETSDNLADDLYLLVKEESSPPSICPTLSKHVENLSPPIVNDKLNDLDTAMDLFDDEMSVNFDIFQEPFEIDDEDDLIETTEVFPIEKKTGGDISQNTGSDTLQNTGGDILQKNDRNNSGINTSDKKLKQFEISSFFAGKNGVKVRKLASDPLPTTKKITKEKSKPDNQKNVIKQCPFYKKIPDTSFTVDAFRYGEIPGCKFYFLTHFHYDHYGGLTKKFQGIIYCSEVTGNLVISELGIDKSRVKKLPMNERVVIDDVEVILLDANHCPGSVMFYFILRDNRRLLHVGDFRADMSMFSLCKNLLERNPVEQLFLDTTYCNPEYNFPSQRGSIEYVRRKVRSILTSCPATLICVGSYTIGKERVFRAIADELDIKFIGVSKKKLKVLNCLEEEELEEKLTTDYEKTNLHVIPMQWLNFHVIIHLSFTKKDNLPVADSLLL